MASKIQFRRDTSANWTLINPVLSEGEIGLDLTNNQFKIGNGIGAWNSLNYWSEGQAYEQVEFTATAGQTVFSVAYQSLVDVSRNGFALAPSDFTLTNGTTVTLSSPCVVSDLVIVRVWKGFSIVDFLPIQGGTLTGPLTSASLISTGTITSPVVSVTDTLTTVDLNATGAVTAVTLTTTGDLTAPAVIGTTSVSAPTITSTGSLSGDNITATGTEYLKLPTGTTAQRPAAPSAGMLRYNSTIGAIEGYTGSEWSLMTGLNADPAYVSIVMADLVKTTITTTSFAYKINNNLTVSYFDYINAFIYLLDTDLAATTSATPLLNIYAAQSIATIFLGNTNVQDNWIPNNIGATGFKTYIDNCVTGGFLSKNEMASVSPNNGTVYTASFAPAANSIYVSNWMQSSQTGTVSLIASLGSVEQSSRVAIFAFEGNVSNTLTSSPFWLWCNSNRTNIDTFKQSCTATTGTNNVGVFEIRL